MSLVGQTISHYEIIEQLGAGGMGVVYKARDLRLDRLVALKFLPPEFSGDAEANERFMQEAKAASALDHSNICTIHDIDRTDDGRLFIVMPAYDGQTLKYRVKDGPLSVEKSVDVTRQMAKGLARAHEVGIVHRDIKPANIMVTDRGEVKILDFGVAKLHGLDITKTGTTLGTVWYMSPEQTRGEPVDGRSDLWSLGVVMFEMLTGHRPFVGDYDQAVAYSILNSDPDPVSDLNADVPDHIVSVIGRLLEKDAGARFDSASDVVDALRTREGDTATESRAETAKDAAGGGRRRVSALSVIVAAVALIGILAIFSYTLMDSDLPDTAETIESAEEPDNDAGAVAKLAVLPFSNMRPDPETDFLGYALADQVIGSLSYVQNLTVRPSNSVRQYQHGEYNLGEVKDELAVAYVLAGNYLRQGDRMRLTVELIDLDSEETVWREPIEVSYEDAFEMQDLVAERLLRRLEISFSEDERTRMTANASADPRAYEYYLRSLSHPDEVEGNQLAVGLLHRSIALDSMFAPAWDALGRRSHLMAYWELAGEEVAYQARDYFLKALEVNPELFSALGHLVMLYTDLGETELAMQTVQRMRSINPNSAEGMFAYGYVLRYAGMLDESVSAMRKALAIDPTNPTFRSAGWTFLQTDQYDEAVEAIHLGQQDVAIWMEGEIAIRQGRLDEARENFSQIIASNPYGIIGLSATGWLSALNGDYETGLAAARKWEAADLSDGEGWFFLASIYCLNQAVKKCISTLDVAVDRGYFGYPHLTKCRLLDSARGNPDFDTVLEKARVKHEAFKAKFF